MKTFDEAVRTVLTHQSKTIPTPEEISRTKDLQLAFIEDATQNEVLIQVFSIATRDLLREISKAADAAFVQGTMFLSEGGIQNAQDDVMNAIMSTVCSSFMWGLGVGREMEKQEWTEPTV